MRRAPAAQAPVTVAGLLERHVVLAECRRVGRWTVGAVGSGDGGGGPTQGGADLLGSDLGDVAGVGAWLPDGLIGGDDVVEHVLVGGDDRDEDLDGAVIGERGANQVQDGRAR